MDLVQIITISTLGAQSGPIFNLVRSNAVHDNQLEWISKVESKRFAHTDLSSDGSTILAIYVFLETELVERDP